MASINNGESGVANAGGVKWHGVAEISMA